MDIQPGEEFVLYAGQRDPDDESAFRLRLVSNYREREIVGRLTGTDLISLTVAPAGGASR